MYIDRNQYVENCCYEYSHIDTVKNVIHQKFNDYFDDYLENSCVDRNTNYDKSMKLMQAFGFSPDKLKHSDKKELFRYALKKAEEDFEKDRDKYLRFLNADALDEYEDAPLIFKSQILKNECPVIQKIMHDTKVKGLGKFRRRFSDTDPTKLLEVVKSIYEFGEKYFDEYDDDAYENIEHYDEFGFEELDEDNSPYTVYGVIGGGIRSRLLYKMYPSVFPNRSRSAIWALWYLTCHQTFGCNTDSEFLMIDTEHNITQQNYFYPYELFNAYAFEIYKLLKEKACEIGAYINTDYRYAVVDSFLNFVFDKHSDEINELVKDSAEKEESYV